MVDIDAAAILAIDDRPLVPVEVPEWKTTVYIRTMSGAERDALAAEMNASKDKLNNLRARMAVRVLCNAAGERLFTDAQAEALGEKSTIALDRIFPVAQKLNYLGAEGVADAGKDSASTLSGSSGSASPSPSAT